MSTPSSVELSVVVPAFNECHRMRSSLERILKHLHATVGSFELIVVDDGSTDDTSAIAQSIAELDAHVHVLRLPTNRGKGAAVRAGVLHSVGREVLFTDADLSTPIEELQKLRRQLVDADLVLGSRTIADDEVRRDFNWRRRVIGRTFRLAVRLLCGAELAAIRDTQCGFKLIRGSVGRLLFAQLQTDGFAFDIELLMLAAPALRIAEVAVHWHHRDGSRVSVLRDSLAMLRDVMRIRARLGRSRRARALPAAPPQQR